MKFSILFLATAMLSAVGCASPTEATETEAVSSEVQAAPRKIRSDRKLVSALNALTDVASGGPSLAFFGWKENPSLPATGCRAASAADAKAAFSALVDLILSDGDQGEAPQLTPAVIADAKARFASLVGPGGYTICENSTSGFMSIGTITTIASTTSSGVKVAFETGYED